ncbi:hypothetical protein M404DRAFT_22837 [Pisolithus tinctorius Marx 270]|uniref:CBS domain-containing protein n=1 Tax=Pisolithus tinctorius Marx 270 TaxID=870435 RepID=A0A0C3P548_PISTI|nr:hypothetical protein M404DRAFT_22837 [Pisolithus tinctorius Marx 270]
MMNASLSPTQSPRTPKRKPSTRRPRAPSHLPPVQSQEAHDAALHAIRNVLKGRTCYDAFPVSYRLIVLDTKLNVKKALHEKSKFAGMLTVLDIIHLIQYYYDNANYDTATADVETFRLESLRGQSTFSLLMCSCCSTIIPDIEKSLGVATPPMLREHPSSTFYDAAKLLIQTHARRLPLLDYDTETGHEVIVSVLTQYRLLKFISINCTREVQQLHLSLRKLKIGTYVSQNPPPDNTNPYWPIATATLDSPVFDVVHMFSERAISAVPIIDKDGVVVNLYETVDVITLVRLGAYQALDLTISEALNQRSPDFPGVVICTAGDSLGTLLQLIKKRRVHRLVVVQGEEEEKRGGKKGRLLGIITLSDVLRYLIGNVAIGEGIDSIEESASSSTDKVQQAVENPCS